MTPDEWADAIVLALFAWSRISPVLDARRRPAGERRPRADSEPDDTDS